MSSYQPVSRLVDSALFIANDKEGQKGQMFFFPQKIN